MSTADVSVEHKAIDRRSLWRRVGDTRVRDLVRFRLDDTVRWRDVIACSELPGGVRQLVEQVVRRTRLWPSEKKAVAEELLAHFDDGLAAGARSDDLLEAFGNALTTARLIRRAKRRDRPMWWHVWHWGWISLATLIAVYVLLGLYQLTGDPQLKVNYLREINERALESPAGERAWPLYREALEQLAQNGEFPKWAWNPAFAPNDPEWPAAAAWLESHQAGLQLVREAAARSEFGLAISVQPGAYSPEDRAVLFDASDEERWRAAPVATGVEDTTLAQGVLHWSLPHSDRLTSLTHLLAIDARRAAVAGDGAAVLADAEAILGIADHLQQTPLIDLYRMAGFMREYAYNAVEEALIRKPDIWGEAELKRLAHQIASSESDWSRAFQGERIRFLDVLQRFYTDDGGGDGRLAFRGPAGLNVIDAVDNLHTTFGPNVNRYTSDSLAALALPAVNWLVASRQEMIAAYDEYAADALGNFSKPYWAIPWNASHQKIDSMASGLFGEERYLFVRVLAPVFDHYRLESITVQGERDGVLIGLALHLYQRTHGKWPASLDELSPRWLPNVPVDLVTGRPLRYKIVDDRPLVYSVGIDEDDDGGVVVAVYAEEPNPRGAAPASQNNCPPASGDWVIWDKKFYEPAKTNKEAQNSYDMEAEEQADQGDDSELAPPKPNLLEAV